MEDHSEVKKGTNWRVVVVLVILGLLAYMIISTIIDGTKEDKICCQKVCDYVGNGLTCHEYKDDEMYCALDYVKYDLPGVSEIFTIHVEDKDTICGGD
jgi:hypothetical protein